jgi:hypothetical protein
MTDAVPDLPPLPERVARTWAIAGSFDVHWMRGYCEKASEAERGDDLHTAAQMQTFGRACYEAGAAAERGRRFKTVESTVGAQVTYGSPNTKIRRFDPDEKHPDPPFVHVVE